MKRSELWCDLRSHFTSITESNSDPLPFNNYNIKTPIAQHFDLKKQQHLLTFSGLVLAFIANWLYLPCFLL